MSQAHKALWCEKFPDKCTEEEEIDSIRKREIAYVEGNLKPQEVRTLETLASEQAETCA